MCDAHVGKLAAANAPGDKSDGGPEDLAYSASVDFINDTKATTLAGLLAKARAAKAEAAAFYSDSDEEHWQNCPAENWAPDVCNELLELSGSRAAPPDADLLALVDRFLAHEQTIQAMPCNAVPGTPAAVQEEAEQRQIFGVKHALIMQLGDLRATTADGVAARARCLAIHNADGAFAMDDPNTDTGRLLRYLMRDAGALGGSAIQPLTSPDAELLQTCAAFDEMERASLATFQGQEPGSAEETAAETERERLSEAQEPLVERMCELEAITRDGMAARARSLALWGAELMKPDRCFIGDRLTAAIVRDLLAGSAVA